MNRTVALGLWIESPRVIMKPELFSLNGGFHPVYLIYWFNFYFRQKILSRTFESLRRKTRRQFCLRENKIRRFSTSDYITNFFTWFCTEPFICVSTPFLKDVHEDKQYKHTAIKIEIDFMKNIFTFQLVEYCIMTQLLAYMFPNSILLAHTSLYPNEVYDERNV